MADRRNVLVIGATGKQGGAVVKALLALPQSGSPLHILAVTRNPESAAAQALVADKNGSNGGGNGGVALVTGDLSNARSIFATQAKGSVSAAFLVTIPGRDEERFGKAFVDAAVDHDVPHIVFASVERGGNDRSWANPTEVPHFRAKHNIELYLRQQSEDKNKRVTYTILRPTAFLDNLNPGRFSGIFVAAWKAALPPPNKLQLVAVRDIGVCAARALTEPAADRWAGRAIGLAGAEMTLTEAQEKFRNVTGQELPEGYGILARMLLWAVSDLGRMFTFFREEGYGVDITALRRETEEDVWDFETWLREGSQWETRGGK